MKMSKKLVSLLLAAAMLLGLAACGDGSGSTAAATGSAGTPEVSAAPEGGGAPDAQEASSGTLRVGLDGEPQSLAATETMGTNGAMFVGYCLYDTCWRVNTNGERTMLLADEYTLADDNSTITIHIRDNANFSNGDPVTAEDVLFSMGVSDSTMGDQTAAFDLDASHADGDKTLVVAVKTPTPAMIDQIGSIPVMSKSWTEDFTNEAHIYTDILGCGPYMLAQDWSTGSPMYLKKNPNYHSADTLKYENIECYFVGEETTRYLSFQNNEYDICYLTDSANIEAVKADTARGLYSAPVEFVAGLIWNTYSEDSPYKNNDLRLAMCHAVDVPTLVESICGSAYIPATSFMPSASWAYKNTAYEYDPELAKEYFEKYKKETGEDGFEFTVTINDSDINNGLAEAIQYAYSEIGIKMNIESVDMATYFGFLMDDSCYCTITQYSGSGDPGSVLNSWLSTSMYELQKTNDEIMPKLDAAANSMGSQEERTKQLHEVQDLMKEYAPILPLYETTINYALVSPDVDISASVMADGYLFPQNIK